jgi:hypothetical protein
MICEDIAHQTFIKTFLPKFLKHFNLNLNIEFNEKFFYRFKSRNSKDVLKKYANAGIIAFRDYDMDLLIIGVDYDDRDRGKFDKEIAKLYNEIDKKLRSRSVIFFPVQALEHWLLFIQRKIGNPKLLKNISNEIESIPRNEAKEKIFRSKRPNRIAQEQIITVLIDDIDIGWLISNSQSFRSFCNDLRKFFTK